METIFDHNPTDKELLGLFNTLEDAENYKVNILPLLRPDSVYAEIAGLMNLRKDNESVKKYLSKIKDTRYRETTRQGLIGCFENNAH